MEINKVSEERMKAKIQAEKILFLTLGTGVTPQGEKLAYRSTEYRFDKNDREDSRYISNFVAEPLIHDYNPDKIYVLGTVKSVWYQLFATFITDNNEDTTYTENIHYKELLDIALSNEFGKDTAGDTLKSISEKIQKCFDSLNEEGNCKRINGIKKLNVKILLTQYGINEEQLKENYSIIKGIEKHLNTEAEYEVAFDITHSFRSLPLYNLVIFNYIKNVTLYNFNLKHIYYGNLDVSRELGYAPIVDLKDLVEILDLTSGVAEFKNTGNAISLLKMLNRDEQENLSDILNTFNIVTQTNAFNIIGDCLNDLIGICQESSRDSWQNRYTGMMEMILEVLKDKFLGNQMSFEDLKDISSMNLKFLLAEWYFNQGRLGLGLATGLEALRDLNTPIFIEARELSDQEPRKYRENAEAYFIEIAKRLENKVDRDDLENTVYKLGINLKSYKQIRNIFAHSLEDETLNVEDIISKIDDFREQINTLTDLVKKYDSKYKSLFGYSSIDTSHNIQGIGGCDSCRLIIDFNVEDGNYEEYVRSKNNNKEYHVYCLEASMKKLLFGRNIRKNGKYYFNKDYAFFLYRYICSTFPKEYKEIHIVLLNVPTSEIEVSYRVFLENLEKEFCDCNKFEINKADNSAYKKLGIPIVIEEFEEEYEKEIKSSQEYINSLKRIQN